MSARLEVHLTPEARDGLGRFAAERGSTAEKIASEAVEHFVRHDIGTVQGIERSLDDLRHGRTVPHDEVLEDIEQVLRGA